MEYRYLGRTGIKVSALCLGTMQFGWTVDESGSFDILDKSYEAGINFIDTADVYSRWVEGNAGGVAERIIGAWMKKNQIPRHQLILATKVRGPMGEGPNDQGLSRKHIMKSVEDSLRRLQTDYIDLYQTHFYDENTPVEVTLSTMDDLVRQGKVRYVGCSNYPAWRLMEALWASDKYGLARYDSLQPHYSMVHRIEFELEHAELCRKYGLGVIPYSPLAGGFLTGKYRQTGSTESARANHVRQRFFSDENFTLLDKIETVGKKHAASISQVALAWMLANPVITSPIIGPRSLEQLQDNLGSVNIQLDGDALAVLDEASKNSCQDGWP